MRKNFSMPSSDKVNTLQGCFWTTEEKPKAVIQIIHGMNEYTDRFEEFATAMNKKKIAVCMVDQLGHGRTARTQEDRGYFSERNSKKYLLFDQHNLTAKIKDEYEGVPIFLLGNSMGSFIARRYMTLWGDEIDGAIIMATADYSVTLASIGRFVTFIMRLAKGSRYRSKFVYYLFNKKYDTLFKLKCKGSWLSRDYKKVRELLSEDLSNFIFTVGAYHTVASIMLDLAMEKNDSRIPKDLPICFFSGMEDPLGDYTKGVLNVYNEYVGRGIKDVDIKLYPKDRHLLFAEPDKEEIFYDVASFVLDKIS